MEMDYYGIISTIITAFLGGGWFIYYKANKRKADAEATHSEAEGWKSMQDLYQQTIEDFKVYSEDMRTERTVLKQENSEMRDRYKKLDDEIIQLKRRLSRQGRKIDALSPFLCSVVGCLNRKKVSITALEEENEQQNTESDGNNQEGQ